MKKEKVKDNVNAIENLVSFISKFCPETRTVVMSRYDLYTINLGLMLLVFNMHTKLCRYYSPVHEGRHNLASFLLTF